MKLFQRKLLLEGRKEKMRLKLFIWDDADGRIGRMRAVGINRGDKSIYRFCCNS